MTSTMTSTINGDIEFGSDGFPTEEEYDRRKIKLGGPVNYCGGGRWMLRSEVANCNDCETPLNHLRDGTTEEGQRCNNCYWEGQGGRDAAEAIITPDYRIIRVEFGEIDNTDQEEDDLSPFRCIDCDEDVRTKKAFWGCEVCGLNTCEECCENDYGYVMCAGCVREKQEKKPKNKKKRKKLVIIY